MISQSGPVLEILAQLRRIKWTAVRVAAKARFELQRKKRSAPLSEEQVGQFHRDGYLLVSGLISEGLASGAESAIWQGLGAAPDAPETWAILGPQPHLLPDERFVVSYTDAMLAAAAQLAGEDVAAFSRPKRGFIVNRVPVSRDWRHHQPHLDCSLPELRHRTLTRSFWIGSLTYLTDVPSHGGGTIVWPGSHLKLEALARGDPRKYKYLSTLNADLDRVALGPAVELTASRGDVLFHHYLCVHASSDNASGTPRLAIKHKW